MGMKLGGGGIGALLIGVVIVLLSGGDAGDVLNQVAGQLGNGGIGTGDLRASDESGDVGTCTADQANSDRECRLSATMYALDAYWTQTLPQQARIKYVLPDAVSFSGSVNTACGAATSASGPFYCPGDQTLYEDVTFFDQMFAQIGGKDGSFAEEYVVAHEVGHHVEQITGVMDQARRGGSGADSDSVKIELMADCLAGMWAGQASTTIDPNTGRPFLEPITKAQLTNAIEAAQTVGDDHIQSLGGGRPNPESFTHGTSAQRVKWFTIGYQNNSLQQCNTFQASSL
jgi:predicted metalloprotease